MGLRIFFVLLVLLLFCSISEGRSKTRSRRQRIRNEKRLQTLCDMQKNANSTGTALELHAYFDLSNGKKPLACLKVSTCNSTPVCFVTTHPYLKNKSINDTTTWQELVTFIQITCHSLENCSFVMNMLKYMNMKESTPQSGITWSEMGTTNNRDRKIEPIYDTSMSGWKGDRHKALSQYVDNQPAIHRMCRKATVYRFVVNENVTNATNNDETPVDSSSSPGNSSDKPAVEANSNPAMTLCPLFKRKKGKSTRIKRVGRTKNKTSRNFFLCEGFNCPCVRICVGQGKTGNNFTECSTFRIICTFNCGSDTIEVPQAPVITTPTRRRRKKNRRHRLKNSKKQRKPNKSKSRRQHPKKPNKPRNQSKSNKRKKNTGRNRRKNNKGNRKGNRRPLKTTTSPST